MIRKRSKTQRPDAKRQREKKRGRAETKSREAQARNQRPGAKVVVILERAVDASSLAAVVRRLAGAGHVVKLLSVRGEVPETVVSTMAPAERRAEREPVGWEPLAGDPQSIERQLDAEHAEVVVACPALSGAPQVGQCLEVARHRAVPTVGLPGTWEELARAAVPAGLPDLVLAWNQPLADLARGRGVPGERLLVTGAPQLDPYFRWMPDRHRESFCAELGLDHRRPFVAYRAAGTDEVDGVADLARALREDPATRAVQLLVRPPPGDIVGDDWLAADATLWHPGKEVVHRRKVERELLTGLRYAAAAVGATVSSLVVAAVVDRPCILLSGKLTAGPPDDLGDLAPADFAETASEIEQAVAGVRAALAQPDSRRSQRHRFVATFVRPRGVTRPVVPAVARIIEAAALEGVAGARARALDQRKRARAHRSGVPERSAAAERPDAGTPVAASAQPAGGAPGLEPSTRELAQIVQMRIAHLVQVREPLVLISQIQRSGGTLLNQLIDGHPQCHVHPHELHIGYPFDKESWPELDPSGDPEKWLDMLRQRPSEAHFFTGYAQSSRNESHPFLLVPSVQRELFRYCVTASRIESPRDILDCYMTSYFNAWLDSHNLVGEDKRWVVGFGAQLGVTGDSRERFFRDYPDGRLISIIREPQSWFASARRLSTERYGDLERSLRLWSWSAAAMIEAKERHGDRVLIVRFESLLRDTEATMRAIGEFLALDYLPELCRPTFNGLPIKANSAFPVARHGVLAEPLSRDEQLDPDTLDYIDRHASELYARAAALAR